MTDKFKKRVREFAAKTGMSHQAAHNVLTTQPTTTRAAVQADVAVDTWDPRTRPIATLNDDEWLKVLESLAAHASRAHEDGCPLRGWEPDSAEPEPRCECIGIDRSELLLDGDDVYD
jgi:hypothetical protein